MSDLYCPYCDEELEFPDDCHDTQTNYEWECEKCGKNFIFTVEYCPTFTAQKADCLNGKNHKWEKICGIPEEAFTNRYRCIMCEKEKRP